MATPTVSLKVGDILDKKGITTAEFTEMANLAPATALAYRRGVPTRLDRDILARICEALDVEPGDILIMEESPA